MQRFKSQSAMEYLMTYGWALLIIAVVLVAFYQLGVFGNAIGAPRAVPGGCQVVKTIAGSSLDGECQGQLPQYVASIPETSTQQSYVQIPDSSSLDSFNTLTVSAWVYPGTQLATNPLGTVDHEVLSKGQDMCAGYTGDGAFSLMGGAGTTSEFEFCIATTSAQQFGTTPAYVVTPGSWYFVTGTFNGAAICLYVNGILVSCTATAGSIQSGTGNVLEIGVDSNGGNPWKRAFNGQVADVQVYNTSLSSNEIWSLYSEGIGGAPIRPQSIEGWWPLNGNPNDYSENNNNGAVNGILYSSSWINSYTPP